MSALHKAVAVIFAGGEGKRLWPLSTEANPKQINTAFSKDSMLVDTYNRALKVFPKEDIVVVTTEQIEPAVRALVDIADKNLLVQPKNADTTAAMSLTAMYLETMFPESIAVVLYSDHVITQTQKFKQAIKRAVDYAAADDRIIALGTPPAYPNSEFGYLKVEPRVTKNSLYRVEGFVEKPDPALATQLVHSKQWLWNTGIKVWKVSVLLNALKQADPNTYRGLLDLRAYIDGPQYERKLKQWYDTIEPASFEDRVTKKLPELYVYAADYAWEDIGNWQTIYRLADKDVHNNAVQPLDAARKNVRFVDSSGCLVVADNAQVTLMGVKDLVVIRNKDLLFICSRESLRHIKEITS